MAHEYFVHLDSEISLEELGPRLWFQVSLSSEYFLEIARLRALRLLWPQLIRAYRPEIKIDSPLLQIHIHGCSSMHNKTFSMLTTILCAAAQKVWPRLLAEQIVFAASLLMRSMEQKAIQKAILGNIWLQAHNSSTATNPISRVFLIRRPVPTILKTYGSLSQASLVLFPRD